MSAADRDTAARDRRRAAVGRAARSVNAWIGVALACAIAAMANYLGARRYLRADWTRARVFSLSDRTAAFVRSLDRDVKATAFVVPTAPGEPSLASEVRELLERLRGLSPRLAVEFIDPDRDLQKAQRLLDKYHIRLADLEHGVAAVFECGERHKYVTGAEMAEFDWGEQGRRLKSIKAEGAFLAALQAVVHERQPSLCFTSGHGEADLESFEDDGLSSLAEALKRENLRPRKLGPDALHGGAAPKDCDLVVVAGPARPLAPVEADAIDALLDGGGRLLALAGPVFDQGLSGFGDVGLSEVLSTRGITLGRNLVLDVLGVPGEELLVAWATQEGYGEHAITGGYRGRLTVWPRAREVRAVAGAEGVTAVELVKSSEQGWGETSLAWVRGEGEVGYDPATDVKGPVPIAAAAEHAGSKARLVVFGSDWFVRNYRVREPRDYDVDLVLSSVAWLLSREALTAVGPRSPEHFKLALTEEQVSDVLWVSFVALPGAGVALGLIVWWRRRR